LTLLAMALLSGCRSGGTAEVPRGTPAPAPTVRPVMLQPTTGHYRVASHARIRQELQGRVQETSLELVYFATVVTGRDTAQRLRATVRIDSVEADSAGMLNATDRARAVGAEFSATVLDDGRLALEHGSDSLLAGRLRQIATGFWQAFPRIPATGILPGERWTDTTEVVTRSTDADITIHSINHRESLPWMDQQGLRTIPVRVESGYTLEGTGQQLGQPFDLNGRGARSTLQHIAHDGRYLGAEVRDSANIEVVLTQMGLTIPGAQVRHDTLSLLP
jgi:hypothetical protein